MVDLVNLCVDEAAVTLTDISLLTYMHFGLVATMYLTMMWSKG